MSKLYSYTVGLVCVLKGFGKVFINNFLNFTFNIEKIFYITSILPPLLMTEVSSILSLLILVVLPFDLNLLVNTIVCSLHMVSKNSCNAFVWSLLPCWILVLLNYWFIELLDYSIIKSLNLGLLNYQIIKLLQYWMIKWLNLIINE